ncbi:hypothetical protein T4D_14934 [Trichinella pseudospiralis]|uniref:Uncharacterized protein n=1 Tax=Trichinella pseudospiralis TaxID=6337 RepID=A0A0V1FK23_TRIPS|nr:hypothetical protein T4D_14934 [Trichinella pseudospiralis]
MLYIWLPSQSRDKRGCGGAVWTNLAVTSVIKQNNHIAECSADEHLAYMLEKRQFQNEILKQSLKRGKNETHPGYL